MDFCRFQGSKSSSDSCLWILILLSILKISFAQFTTAQIYQDNPIAGETNRLYVRLAYNQPLYSGATITISNLANANAATARTLSPIPNMQSGDVSAVPFLSCSGSVGVGCWTQGSIPFLNALTMTIPSGSVSLIPSRMRCSSAILLINSSSKRIVFSSTPVSNTTN
jgi:hypothetical protein